VLLIGGNEKSGTWTENDFPTGNCGFEFSAADEEELFNGLCLSVCRKRASNRQEQKTDNIFL